VDEGGFEVDEGGLEVDEGGFGLEWREGLRVECRKGKSGVAWLSAKLFSCQDFEAALACCQPHCRRHPKSQRTIILNKTIEFILGRSERFERDSGFL
jgi:hypothetical protein